MRARRLAAATALVALAAGGCAVWPFNRTATAMLARADRLAADGEYREAVAAYDEFLAGHGDDGAAPRARANRALIASLVEGRVELDRLRQELARLREDLTKREGDLVRVRQELTARQAEADRLRADLERLKQIDLRLERRR